MKFRFSKSAVSFLEKLDTKNVNRIRGGFVSLLHFIKEKAVILFTETNIHSSVNSLNMLLAKKFCKSKPYEYR